MGCWLMIGVWLPDGGGVIGLDAAEEGLPVTVELGRKDDPLVGFPAEAEKVCGLPRLAPPEVLPE